MLFIRVMFVSFEVSSEFHIFVIVLFFTNNEKIQWFDHLGREAKHTTKSILNYLSFH